MLDTPLTIGLTLAGIGTMYLFARMILYGPKGLITRARLKEARELELKTRMARGLSTIQDFARLAHIYMTLDRLLDAERISRQALALAESELGKENLSLVSILDEYAVILKRLKRTYEAKAVSASAREIANSRNLSENS